MGIDIVELASLGDQTRPFRAWGTVADIYIYIYRYIYIYVCIPFWVSPVEDLLLTRAWPCSRSPRASARRPSRSGFCRICRCLTLQVPCLPSPGGDPGPILWEAPGHGPRAFQLRLKLLRGFHFRMHEHSRDILGLRGPHGCPRASWGGPKAFQLRPKPREGNNVPTTLQRGKRANMRWCSLSFRGKKKETDTKNQQSWRNQHQFAKNASNRAAFNFFSKSKHMHGNAVKKAGIGSHPHGPENVLKRRVLTSCIKNICENTNFAL